MLKNNIVDKIVRIDWRRTMPKLKPILDGYRSNWNRVYIGVTTDPDRRWNRHQPMGWDHMALIYEALAPNIAQELEQDMIDYARRCNFKEDIQNIGPGGEGIGSSSGFHYLYLLVGDKKR